MGQSYEYRGEMSQSYEYKGEMGQSYEYRYEMGQSYESWGEMGQSYEYRYEMGQSYEYRGKMGQSYEYRGEMSQSYEYKGEMGQSYEYRYEMGQSYEYKDLLGCYFHLNLNAAMAYSCYRSRYTENDSSSDSEFDGDSILPTTTRYRTSGGASLLNELVGGFRKFKIGEEKRRYGYFQCPECPKKWESGNAWCIYKGITRGSEVWEPSSEQSCKKCDIMTPPYETKKLDAPDPFEVRHVDQNKAHLATHCSRCIAGRFCRAA
ncbi:uncharacterized protein [Watersipora subatra]|uniref:uncharacterized protein n=1 Tax=Watersipora subatra TaxID=2589382 RepID=UPI00355AF66F